MRAFIAVEFSPEVKQKIHQIQGKLRKYKTDVKWVEEKNYHLTLSFLGEISSEQADAIISVISSGLQNISSFEIVLSGLGVFPNKRNPRVIWMGITQGQKELNFIYSLLKNILQEMDFEFSNNFKPHVTLGRVRSRKNIEDLISSLPKISFTFNDYISEIVFMESKLLPKGPVYTQIFSFKLKES
ncbi:MAG: 2'-5' RNA ligase [Clostridia bacterium 41_269]|nr:MAG: 2'-5' RNA ligase [Clostridia bacterium 41_269]